MIKLSRFGDFAAFEAFGADLDPLDRPLHDDLDPLQIRAELTKRFTDNLGTRAAGPLDLTAPFILLA